MFGSGTARKLFLELSGTHVKYNCLQFSIFQS